MIRVDGNHMIRTLLGLSGTNRNHLKLAYDMHLELVKLATEYLGFPYLIPRLFEGLGAEISGTGLEGLC
jgi:hypothetical protein